MQGQCCWLSPCSIGQSCSRGQKIQPWLVAFGIQLEGKGATGGERRERDGQAGRKGAEKEPLLVSVVWKELCLSHQKKDRLHQPCLGHRTLPGRRLQVQSN